MGGEVSMRRFVGKKGKGEKVYSKSFALTLRQIEWLEAQGDASKLIRKAVDGMMLAKKGDAAS
jgi:hypothetical protein